ncbi:MAG TPA: aminomethyltransferase family protein [Pyrinomonadaceae bacterium]|jgi:folate-binding protein YgfZ|nr:aminomethyltransferase family protein [Pyrinomonadaceae bacterium]
MTEAVETKDLSKSPLEAIQERLGAKMIEHNGWSMPESYGDVLLEYAAVRECGCGVIDLSSRGRILVSGTEAVQFLNGLITNDMKTLAVNSWMPAAFPNVQGRLIASVRVMRLMDEGTDKNVSPAFLIDTEAATHEKVLKTIERFTLAGDFRVKDVTGETAMLSVQGKKATDVVRTVLGDAAAGVAANQLTQIADNTGSRDGAPANSPSPASNQATVIRASHTGTDGFDLVVNAERAGSLWEALQSAGACPVGYEALEILRIEAGLPCYGADMDETNVVTEAALDDAVSYTKGCYVGQEIIARIKYRGHVARKLTGMTFEQAVTVAVGATVNSEDDKEVGRVTSVTYSPHLGRTIALAYLKYDFLAAGTSLRLSSADGDCRARVSELPFVRETA